MMHDGKVLLIGVNLNSLTSFHIYEDMIFPDVDLGVYQKYKHSFQVKPVSGVLECYRGFIHSSTKTKVRDVERMRPAYIESGALKTVKLKWGSVSVVSPLEITRVNLQQLKLGRSAYGAVTLTSREKDFVDRALDQLLDMKKSHSSNT